MAVMSRKTKIKQVEPGTLFVQIPIIETNFFELADEIDNIVEVPEYRIREIKLSFDGCDRYSGYDPENDIYYYWDIDENHPYLNGQLIASVKK